MSTTASPVSTLLLAGSALVVAAAAYQFMPGSGGSTSIREIDDENVYGEEDYITADEVTKIFNRLFLEMQQVLANLSQQVQQIQMSGHQIPEAQLRKMLRAEFERALTGRQKEIFAEFNMEEDCLEEATWEFMDQPDKYPEVVKSVERFQKLYENVSGESVVGRRPGDDKNSKAVVVSPSDLLGPDKVVEAAEVYFSALTAAMKDVIKGYEGKDLKNPKIAQEVQMKFSQVANDKGEKALEEKVGISASVFQASIEKNASDPTVARALAMLQMKQQQDLISMGLPA
uniref:Uncharacterized protein n=2 Tax=Grammatophora oceanica TaxID=210454 RepID=A0A7S1VE77_9STRA|mmetsp:Transcript_44282/g.65707  ORF Transcript_44282/g.65707 Transcript_44282/m.65707 type:complete len:286 (+) Transcript_44282:173-1030(+)|eukprot:CAMPEP_0194026504 /NCGR_PEP_ID=MMETSP0009_2-20130614/789_1 /TAXON_ID=210454 /ORGANISM="Grammatophora oceanica, Strain CCMP 410" /LENGTH=285 /DNA_ID=CAMNT_0038665203 /DNA_START=142 /DNA_END=999 /DNA_ORIENTATION=-